MPESLFLKVNRGNWSIWKEEPNGLPAHVQRKPKQYSQHDLVQRCNRMVQVLRVPVLLGRPLLDLCTGEKVILTESICGREEDSLKPVFCLKTTPAGLPPSPR